MQKVAKDHDSVVTTLFASGNYFISDDNIHTSVHLFFCLCCIDMHKSMTYVSPRYSNLYFWFLCNGGKGCKDTKKHKVKKNKIK